MISPEMLAANRQNALKSTGPKTEEGKAVVALNPVQGGLYAKTIVLPVLGETPEEWNAFLTRVIDDLKPEGVVENELVERIATILWRIRRVAAYEATASIPADLPPHPDEIAPKETPTCIPPPSTAPISTRLAYLKFIVPRNRSRLAATRQAIDFLDGNLVHEEKANEHAVTSLVIHAAGDVRGWSPFDRPDPWIDVLKSLEVEKPELGSSPWTYVLVQKALELVAADYGKSTEQFRADVRNRLNQQVLDWESVVKQRESELQALSAELLEERRRVALMSLYSDEKTVIRIAKAEAHVGRELERAIAMLDRVKACKRRVDVAALLSICQQIRVVGGEVNGGLVFEVKGLKGDPG